MARRAGEISALVRTAFPSHVIGAVMTRQADLIRLGRLHLLDLWHVPAGVVFHMGLAGSMTALSALCGRGRSWVLCLSVGSALQRFFFFTMALETFRGADVSACLRG
jgi:hypothetical protein